MEFEEHEPICTHTQNIVWYLVPVNELGNKYDIRQGC